MTMRLFGVLAALILGSCASVPTQSDDSLHIEVGRDTYVLSVPVSKLNVVIPKGGLVPKSRDPSDMANRRYFYLDDTQGALVVSGWFEPGRLYPGVKTFWEKETEAYMAKGLPAPEAVSFTRIGAWDVIAYHHELPQGISSHLRAHLVRDGTWIDLHISTTSRDSAYENSQKLTDFLTSVGVNEKSNS